MQILEIFLWGIFGGFLAELAGLFEIRRSAPQDLPLWMKSLTYWIITCLMILSGGLLVVLYVRSGASIDALVAVNIGASAPLVISRLTSKTRQETPRNYN